MVENLKVYTDNSIILSDFFLVVRAIYTKFVMKIPLVMFDSESLCPGVTLKEYTDFFTQICSQLFE